MIYAELRKTVIHHLIAGAVLSATIIFAIVLNRYESSLLDAIGRFELIRINTIRLKQSAAEMDSAMKRITSMLPPDYASKTHRELILLSLDDIKMTLKGGEITVTNFEDKAGELSLQVNIKIPVDNYTVLVNRVGYLQSLRFPHFAIKNVTIEKAADKEGAIISRIEGSLKMPVSKIQDSRFKIQNSRMQDSNKG
ncbi:MAG: hypothetical protein OHK0032_12380 [Thermodesulfovibrionales bacterium]